MPILLILWPIAEILLAIGVAHAIGVLETILLLILSWPVGIWAIRAQGGAAWRRLAITVAERRPPGRELLDGALGLIGGTLLLVPGFLTDIVGLILLAPPSRRLMRPLLARNLHRRLFVQASRVAGQPYDVDSTAHDIDHPRLRR